MKYQTGDTFSHYRLEECCGEGSFGVVYRVTDLDTQESKALKMLFDTGHHRDRELHGLENYSGIHHPNLMEISTVECLDDIYYYTMPLADNLADTDSPYRPDTLAHRLHDRQRLSAQEIYDMLNGILKGLETLHDHGLLHRDIKPDNIIWVNHIPLLADLGLTAHENTASFAGTPGFMPAEMVSTGRAAIRSDDFYALGKVIYCALTGKNVIDYPSFPTALTLSGCGPLIHVFLVACNPDTPIKSAAEFRKLLETENKPQNHLRLWICLGVFILCIIWGGISMKTYLSSRADRQISTDQAQSVPQVIVQLPKETPPQKKAEKSTYSFHQELLVYTPQDYNDTLTGLHNGTLPRTLSQGHDMPSITALAAMCQNLKPLSSATSERLEKQRQKLLSHHMLHDTDEIYSENMSDTKMLMQCGRFCDLVRRHIKYSVETGQEDASSELLIDLKNLINDFPVEFQK